MPNLYSYVVAYDSGFAPNPFNGFCTLTTCKPEIRKNATIGDWLIGTGSNRKGVRRGGHLVYAMRVNEILSFSNYWNDFRFEKKKPNLNASYRAACGDNIYQPLEGGGYHQLNSYHSKKDGSPNQKHIDRDTSVDRVLVSNDFVYFGAEGPMVPDFIKKAGLVLSGRGHKKIDDEAIITDFESWLTDLGVKGYQGRPFDMVKTLRGRK